MSPMDHWVDIDPQLPPEFGLFYLVCLIVYLYFPRRKSKL